MSNVQWRNWGLIACVGLAVACGSGQQVRPDKNKLSYHYDKQRTGWNKHEALLSPENISARGLHPSWQSPQLASHNGEAPRLFATPLYLESVVLSSGPTAGEHTSVVYAATGTGYVYAINARKLNGLELGEIIWSRRLTTNPCRNGRESINGTPVIDLNLQRIYVASCDDQKFYEAHAFELSSGNLVPGWPVAIDYRTVNRPGLNGNGSTQFPDNTRMHQRGALNLSLDGKRLYVPLGHDSASGWLISVDTESAEIASAFSTTAKTEEHQGGMWASGGPSIDSAGRIHIATGASVIFTKNKAGIAGVFPESEHNWGQSIIQLTESLAHGLKLTGTYTPFDYCRSQAADIDLGSSGTIVIDLDPSETSTPKLLALIGGKQGNGYLLNRDKMPGSLVKRQYCSEDSSTDLSLLAPFEQPHFGKRGPLSVFGPYSPDLGWFDLAKSRTTAAYFRNDEGNHYIYATGNTKESETSGVSIPPSLVRLRIVTEPGAPAYLTIDKVNETLVFLNPGSPVITSSGSGQAVVWVLDENAPRTRSLWDEENPPQPVLYAIDAETLEVLWKSEEGQLNTSGKYNEPTIIGGKAYVGTDRIQVFELGETGQ